MILWLCGRGNILILFLTFMMITQATKLRYPEYFPLNSIFKHSLLPFPEAAPLLEFYKICRHTWNYVSFTDDFATKHEYHIKRELFEEFIDDEDYPHTAFCLIHLLDVPIHPTMENFAFPRLNLKSIDGKKDQLVRNKLFMYLFLETSRVRRNSDLPLFFASLIPHSGFSRLVAATQSDFYDFVDMIRIFLYFGLNLSNLRCISADKSLNVAEVRKIHRELLENAHEFPPESSPFVVLMKYYAECDHKYRFFQLIIDESRRHFPDGGALYLTQTAPDILRNTAVTEDVIWEFQFLLPDDLKSNAPMKMEIRKFSDFGEPLSKRQKMEMVSYV